MQEEKIFINRELNIWEALIPLIVVISLLTYNLPNKYILFVFPEYFKPKVTIILEKLHFLNPSLYFGDYSNQFILLFGGFVALVIGLLNNVSINQMVLEIWDNFKKTSSAILILILVGALAGSWFISGIIPTMIYYGLQILSPSIFLPATVIIASIISLATGSSWTTTATVGIALIGIGKAIGIPPGMIAGAVISGAYFGDKMSPLSDTTNLAPAMAGTDIFTHIKYMMYTTVPTMIITLIVFTVLSFKIKPSGSTTGDVSNLLTTLSATFNVTPVLFIVPAVVVFLIILKAKPHIALLAGVILASIFALYFQPNIVAKIGGSDTFSLNYAVKGIAKALWTNVSIKTDNEILNGLFNSKGMLGMLSTILLIFSALVFGGIMEAIGALSRISIALLSLSNSIFGLFASTVASCLAINITASDQYLAIVVPGKMFEKAYKKKGLAPENLSRTLEDTGTVTSALVPWNTGGIYQSSVLGVDVSSYILYSVFNYVSPIMTLFFAYFQIKIRKLKK